MAKFDFTVRCSNKNCNREAKYKVAATWSDGSITELKAFGFADEECLASVFETARARSAKILTGDGEEMGPMMIFKLDTKLHDYELVRDTEMEEKLIAGLRGADVES